MKTRHNASFIVIGFALLVIGLLAIFSMVIGLIEKSYVVSFLAYGLSLAGLFLGLFGLGFPGHPD